MRVKYPTVIRQISLNNKLFVMETIRDLDEAIDIICDSLSPEEKLDPFAEDLCPYFGVLWPSGIALAKFLDPYIVKNKTVLELGCGMGLPSLVATHLGGKVLATDFHPDVEDYFLRNCRHSSLVCSYKRLNWRDQDSTAGKFDMVIGSDVLYESKHSLDVAQGLLRLVKPGGKIILTDPGRSYLQSFLNAMSELGHKEDIKVQTVDQNEIFIIEYTV